MSDPKLIRCPAVNSDGQSTCPAGLAVPAGAIQSRRRLIVAVVTLLVIGFITTGGALVLYARAVAGIRADFCTYAATVYKVTRELPQVPARIEAERNDLNLERQLGCPQTVP